MKKIFIFLILGILLIGTLGFFILQKDIQEDVLKPTSQIVETAQGKVIKEYSPSEKLLRLKDIETESETLSAKLDTPQIYKVGAGYGKVAQFTINSKQDYNSILGQFELYDKRNNVKIERQIDIKYLTTQQVEENVYDNKCSLSVNGTETCKQVVAGTRLVNKEVWLPFDNSVKGDEQIIIGLFTDVQVNDKVEWIPTIAGVRVQEWAVWTANLEVGLVAYYKLDEASATTFIDSHGSNNMSNEGASNTTGKINSAYDFEASETDSAWTKNGVTGLDDTDSVSVSVWFKMESFSDAIVHSDNLDDTQDYFTLRDPGTDGTINWYVPAWDSVETDVLATGNWWHVVGTHDGVTNNLTIYVNGVINATTTFAETMGSNPPNVSLSTFRGDTGKFDGVIDEVAIYNRSLTPAEVTQFYNGGSGISYREEIPEISVSLVSPTNDTQTNDDPITFTAQLTPNNYNLTNGTINIWYENGTLFDSTTNSTFSNPSTVENITFSITDWIIGDYYWNVYGCQGNCNSTNSSFADDNFTLEWIPFNNTGEDYNSPVLETSQQIFRINISTSSDWTINNGRVIYDGTIYENADKEDLGGGNFRLIQTINIPAGTTGFSSENRSFNWNITFSEIATGSLFSSTTDENNQTINELIFYLCGGIATEPVLNFTIYDEETGDEINATANPITFQATFSLGAYWDFKNKTYSINNQSVSVNEFDSCTDNSSNIFYVDMEAFYTATDYTSKNYFLNNASLEGNNTNEISFYLLNESNAIEFFIKAKQDLNPITSATVNIEKFFVGEGIYKTVEIDETSSDTGEFTSYLDLDKDYKFTISKSGSVLGIVTKTASCKKAPCELTLSLKSDAADIYSQFSANFGQNVVYNLSWNPNTKIVTFDFIDTTGLADYFRMKVWQGGYNTSSSLIIDSQLYTSSGTITGNLSTYASGDFTANVYVSRSPEIFIDFIKITIKEFVGKFGLLGLFFAFLLALTIIFGLSFNPAILCLSIPLSLTILNLIGILAVSWTGITIVYVLAAIAIGAMIK